jgi:hypothetical protein
MGREGGVCWHSCSWWCEPTFKAVRPGTGMGPLYSPTPRNTAIHASVWFTCVYFIYVCRLSPGRLFQRRELIEAACVLKGLNLCDPRQTAAIRDTRELA